jgi:hypothetical protein
MYVSRLFRGLTVLLLAAAGAAAQDQTTAPPPQRPGFHRGPGFLGPLDGRFGEIRGLFDGKVVKNAPYQATVTTQTIQVLSDGNRITRSLTSTVYRDSQGRTRIESSLGAVGPLVAGHDAAKVFISDPVTGNHYVLSPSKNEAFKLPPFGHKDASNGAAATTTTDGSTPTHRHFDRTKGDAAGGPARQTENLGKQTIQGVEAEGTRTTTTIPAGSIGNENPVEVVSERWYAPSLQKVILRKHSDPRFGETTVTWTNLKTAEPDAALFSVPAGYAIKDAPPFPRRGGPQGGERPTGTNQ